MINEYTAHKFCSEPLENIENYAEALADKTQTWCCHHRLGVQGQFTNSAKLLKKCKMYWHRPAAELIFLTSSEHIRLHAKADKRGKDAVKIMNAKTTNEQRSKACKGKSWWNNGTINKQSVDCPGDGWVHGRLM